MIQYVHSEECYAILSPSSLHLRTYVTSNALENLIALALETVVPNLMWCDAFKFYVSKHTRSTFLTNRQALGF